MARALMGHLGTSNDQLLALEVNRLRRRVAELEAELQAAREHQTETLDIELHRLSETSEPALA
ncbi:hypothetical protein [Jatrophihabitans fulvus]